jgi:hypothetical protein
MPPLRHLFQTRLSHRLRWFITATPKAQTYKTSEIHVFTKDKGNPSASPTRSSLILLSSDPLVRTLGESVQIKCGYSFVVIRKNPSRVNPVEQSHHDKHEQGVKDVQVHFVAQQVSIEALQVFHHAEHGSYHYQHTGGEEDEHVLLPLSSAEGPGGRAPAHFGVEVHVDYHEEAEEEQLDEEASNGDVGAFVERCGVAASRLDSST